MEYKYKLDTDGTIEYYEKNAEEFVKSTINADVAGLYKHFEKYLLPECCILDLGCGSGRDSKYFVERGYNVVAMDPSPAMCAKTKEIADVPVFLMKAEELSFKDKFDAIWACASLLHVSRKNMQETMLRISQALKQGGICYCSWKYGDNDRFIEGRYFADYTEELLKGLLKKIDVLEIMEIWSTHDVRKNRYSQKWLNALLRKISE